MYYVLCTWPFDFRRVCLAARGFRPLVESRKRCKRHASKLVSNRITHAEIGVKLRTHNLANLCGKKGTAVGIDGEEREDVFAFVFSSLNGSKNQLHSRHDSSWNSNRAWSTSSRPPARKQRLVCEVIYH